MLCTVVASGAEGGQIDNQPGQGTLMTSKGPVAQGPRQAAEKPEAIDWTGVSCMPSPSCLPHKIL